MASARPASAAPSFDMPHAPADAPTGAGPFGDLASMLLAIDHRRESLLARDLPGFIGRCLVAHRLAAVDALRHRSPCRFGALAPFAHVGEDGLLGFARAFFGAGEIEAAGNGHERLLPWVNFKSGCA
jgi:hypothetical protein